MKYFLPLFAIVIYVVTTSLAAEVTLYSEEGHRGQSVYINVDGCRNVPSWFDKLASSARTHWGCIYLCEHQNCHGRCEKLDWPVVGGTIQDHHNFSRYNFLRTVSSVRSC